MTDEVKQLTGVLKHSTDGVKHPAHRHKQATGEVKQLSDDLKQSPDGVKQLLDGLKRSTGEVKRYKIVPITR